MAGGSHNTPKGPCALRAKGEQTNMKKQILSIIVALAIVFAPTFFTPQPAQAQQGQNTLTQTTLSAAVTGPALYSGTSPTIQQTVCLASTTGLSAPVLPGTPSSIIYVDREAMGVFSVNTTTGCVLVNRGYNGTQASPHLSGQMVLYGPNYAVTIAQGANPVPNGLFWQDPPQGATCSAGVPTQTWVNMLTGAQWICSSVLNYWVPGFNNPLAYPSMGPTTAVASAATITITGPFFHITGTTGITTINGATGCNTSAVGYCAFIATFDTGAASQIALGGNINVAAAITTTAGATYMFVWNPATAKWLVVL